MPEITQIDIIAGMKRLISIIVPVYNEEKNIWPLYERLLPVFKKLEGRYYFELIFTDNHSEDKSFELLKDLAQKDPRIRVLRFSKNFGYQQSIYTGYVSAQGDAAIQLDCDLQDPPEMISTFLEKWEEGHQVVYGIRKTRKEGFLINRVRRIFYWLIDRLSADKLPRDAGDFRLVDRKILNELKEIHDMHPYLRGTIASFGFRQIGIPYDRDKRHSGVGKFRLGTMIQLALDGILNHSILPLRLASIVGLGISCLTIFGIGIYAVGRLFFSKYFPPGLATTFVLILFSITLNSIFLGIIGEYMGRIYQQVKRRPLVIIENRVNWEKGLPYERDTGGYSVRREGDEAQRHLGNPS